MSTKEFIENALIALSAAWVTTRRRLWGLRGAVKAGDRIRFKKLLTEPANGDHPTFDLAYKGEEGVILRVIEPPGTYELDVKPAGGPHFYCRRDEVEEVSSG